MKQKCQTRLFSKLNMFVCWSVGQTRYAAIADKLSWILGYSNSVLLYFSNDSSIYQEKSF